MQDVYRLLLGSLGDDSHSAGIILLGIAFKESGFQVENIGIMNRLEDFFSKAVGSDAVLISCMNGHTDLYIKDFPYHLKQFNKKNPEPRVWYLGGNLSVQGEPEEVIKRYRKFGFDFVSPKPITCDEVMENLMRDFYRKGIKKKPNTAKAMGNNPLSINLEQIDDRPLSDNEFRHQRQKVLNSWPTGKEVWDTRIENNHAEVQKNMQYVINQRLTSKTRVPLLQPRTGVAHISDEIKILTHLREKGMDISSIQLDAASRKNKYGAAQEGVMRTEEGKTSFLNGYPVPIHGVKGIERLKNSVDTPFQIRAGSPDHRLVYEIGAAGGASSLEGGFICYLFPYDKNTTPRQSLEYWKYVDKMVNMYYKTTGIVINREFFGPLTCNLMEPSIPICINIVQALLSAKQGVKSISVGLAEQGNRSQDVAAIRVLEKMTRRYLQKYRLKDVTVSTVYHQYMAAFPSRVEKAEEIITESSITGAKAGATRMMTKTPVESIQIPTMKENSEGLRLSRLGLDMAKDKTLNVEKINREIALLEREVTAIMKVIEQYGGDSIARGAIRAFQEGVLDIPFSPNVHNRNRLVTARDIDGAIRFVNPEVLPLDKEIIDLHKEKIYQRKKKERATKIYEILTTDLTRIWKGEYLRWPLDDNYIT
jgi:methylaspartate mutase epsilon subunit